MNSPAIINSWNRGAMRRIRSFPDDERLQLLEAITRGAQNAIARARSDQWLHVEHALEVCDALVDVLGPERAVEFWRDLVYDSWVGGLLGPLSASLREGLDEEDDEAQEQKRRQGVLALAPAAWSMSARNCGEVVASADEHGHLQLEIRDLPPIVRVSQGIRALYAGALKAMLMYSRLSASVKIEDTRERFAFSLTFK